MKSRRHVRQGLFVSFITVFYTAIAGAYHDTQGGTTQMEGALSSTELGIFYIAPFIVITALLYPVVQKQLVNRYTGKSVLKKDPEDMRKYSVVLSSGVALLATIIAALNLGAEVAHTTYAGGVGVVAVLALFMNWSGIRSLVSQ